MVDALNRHDKTDPLVEQIHGDRAKVEHSANRGNVQSNHHMQEHPSEAEVSALSENLSLDGVVTDPIRSRSGKG